MAEERVEYDIVHFNVDSLKDRRFCDHFSIDINHMIVLTNHTDNNIKLVFNPNVEIMKKKKMLRSNTSMFIKNARNQEIKYKLESGGRGKRIQLRNGTFYEVTTDDEFSLVAF